MRSATHLSAFISRFFVAGLVILWTIFGAALPHPLEANLPKSFAVFVARYDGEKAFGGVAGTAFFISPNKAITAFHVLQSSSFIKHSLQERLKIWLVHEGRPAIEVQSINLKERPETDITVIDFGLRQMVSQSEIYTLAQGTNSARKVETDGFRANSVGPHIELMNQDLVITGVPYLERIHSQGEILQINRVNLTATDIVLKEVACHKTSFEPILGLSGGPLVSEGKVIGMNSFADPSKKSTWAVDLHDLNL